MSSAENEPPSDRNEAARKRLNDAVARLERVLDARPGGAGPDAAQADLEALKSVAAKVADGLDGTIARLKAILEK